MLWIILICLAGIGALAYFYRDKLAALFPGLKHYIAAGSAFVLALLQYFQTLDWASLLKDNRNAVIAAAVVGLLVLILSWVTPRKDA